jgi:prevent-host-death family protein
MERIGVRELRQHASRYLARAARGESLEITDRGRPVARLVPVIGDHWADLLADGSITPPVPGRDLLDVTPVAVPSGDLSGSAALADLRRDER